MTRQELYDEIKKSSKNAYILEEMKRLGFWNREKPSLTHEMVEKRASLEKELSSLSKQIKDPKHALKEIHKRRMQEALQRREETKAKREATRHAKAKEKEERKKEELGFIGHPFLSKMHTRPNDTRTLQSLGLFEIKSAKDLASKMGVDLRELRFIAYSQKLSTTTHYLRFSMPKKSGGQRAISAPKPKLKTLQAWILEHILNKLPLSDHAHGFVKGRNILTNATPHIGKKVVINCDLQDFFPTITYPRVKGLFESLGYNPEVATLLALITTEAQQQEVMLDGQTLYLYTGKRFLPQGSPASPMISNLICMRLDRRFEGISKALGFTYTRYADDLSFSSQSYTKINQLRYWVEKIVTQEGFTLHPQKTRIMRKGSRQEVTGIVVNQKPSLCRKTLKQFRATLHQIDTKGLEGASWQGQSNNLMASLLGYAHFIAMVDPKKGAKYKEQITMLLQRYPIKPTPAINKSKEEQKEETIPQDENLNPQEVEQSKAFIESVLSLFRG
jgi:RNA-directed DNA polymerase